MPSAGQLDLRFQASLQTWPMCARLLFEAKQPLWRCTMINFVLWVVFGLIAGAAAKFIMPGRDPGGIIITAVLGVVGALLGGFLSSKLFGWDITGFDFRSFAIAIVGSLILLVLYRALTARRQTM